MDAEYLQGRVIGGVIFKDFSPKERAIIWNNMRVFKGIIPSLFTFFQDIIPFEACIDGVKRLVTVPSNKTLFTALDHSYKRKDESQWIQTSETTFQSEKGNRDTCITLGVLGIIAFAWRLHVYLPRDLIRKKRKILLRPKVNQDVLKRLAVLAHYFGFNSPEINALMPEVPAPPIIHDTQEFVPLLVTTGPGVIINERRGRTDFNSFMNDMKYLFLYYLCEDRTESGEGITSFFVLKSWFKAFFEPP